MKTETAVQCGSGWLLKCWGSSPDLPGLRSAAGEPAGRSPGCGYWDQHHSSAASAGSPPGGGYHGDRLPCVKLCDHEPTEKGKMQHDSDCLQSGVYLHIHVNPQTHAYLKSSFECQCQCGTHFHVDKVFHVCQGNPQQITHQINIPLLYSQVQHSLVTFDFLELEHWK